MTATVRRDKRKRPAFYRAAVSSGERRRISRRSRRGRSAGTHVRDGLFNRDGLSQRTRVANTAACLYGTKTRRTAYVTRSCVRIIHKRYGYLDTERAHAWGDSFKKSGPAGRIDFNARLYSAFPRLRRARGCGFRESPEKPAAPGPVTHSRGTVNTFRSSVTSIPRTIRPAHLPPPTSAQTRVYIELVNAAYIHLSRT